MNDQTAPDSHSSNLWLFLELLAKRRNLIAGIVIICTLAALVAAFALPKWYKAKALLLPPKNASLALTGFDEVSEAVSITTGLDLPLLATPSDLYARMLESRKITERIMNRFGLKSRYKARNFEETYKALMKYAEFRVTEEGLLTMTVEDKDPDTAAAIANAFIEELDNLNQEIVSERIRLNRGFIQERLTQVKQELDSSRKALEDFQVRYKTVDFDEQTRLAIEQASKLKVALAETDLELRIGEMSLGKDNAELLELNQRREIIRNQIERLETSNPDSSFFALPVAQIPSLKGQYEVLYSRVRVAEALYLLLLEQNEKTKLNQLDKSSTITVLDYAAVPEEKSRPQRSIIVAGTFGLSFVLALFLAAFLEYLSRLQREHPEDYSRAMTFFGAYFGWLPGVRRK